MIDKFPLQVALNPVEERNIGDYDKFKDAQKKKTLIVWHCEIVTFFLM